MQLTARTVYGLLLRSRLLPADDAKTAYQQWIGEARDAQNGEQFLHWLAARRQVTDYQAALLSRGHADILRLGPYTLLDRIGRGRTAGVYKAVHELGQVVAVKVLPPSKSRDPHLLARFRREARLALRLNHPNVVRTFQTGQAHGLHFLVMEYLEGETFDVVLQRRGRLPRAEAVHVVHQAFLGLQHMYEQGLIHRDLKPANLMLVGFKAASDTACGTTVKVLDIGLGRALDTAPDTQQIAQGAITGEGVILGTPDYMAPEQARDARTTDIRADIYSLGCVLYHALSGRQPFPDTNVISQMVRHATEPPKPLREINADIPEGLEQVVGWMLEKDPAGRYPTPERAAQALEVFLAAEGEATPAADLGRPLSAFLTWLSVGEEDGDEAPETNLDATPDYQPLIEVSGDFAETERGRSSSAPRTPPEHGTQTASRRVPTVRAQAARSAAADAERVDVELVAAPFTRPPAAASPWYLSRRDLMMLGFGGGGVLGGIFTGWLVATITRKRERSGGRREAAPPDKASERD